MEGIWIVASEFHPQNRKIASFLKRETFKIFVFFFFLSWKNKPKYIKGFVSQTSDSQFYEYCVNEEEHYIKMEKFHSNCCINVI
eukprot:UN23114